MKTDWRFWERWTNGLVAWSYVEDSWILIPLAVFILVVMFTVLIQQPTSLNTTIWILLCKTILAQQLVITLQTRFCSMISPWSDLMTASTINPFVVLRGKGNLGLGFLGPVANPEARGWGLDGAMNALQLFFWANCSDLSRRLVTPKGGLLRVFYHCGCNTQSKVHRCS